MFSSLSTSSTHARFMSIVLPIPVDLHLMFYLPISHVVITLYALSCRFSVMIRVLAFLTH